MMAQQSTVSLDGDHNRALELMIPTGITFIAALVLVSLRLYVRIKVVRKLGKDDLFILLGMVGPR